MKSYDGRTFKTFEDLLDYLKETFLPAVATHVAEEELERELEARAAKRLDPTEVRVPCYACRGTGWSDSHRCSVCGGDGKY